MGIIESSWSTALRFGPIPCPSPGHRHIQVTSYTPRVSHIAGMDNKIADVLSRMPQDKTLQAPPLSGAIRHVPPPRPANSSGAITCACLKQRL
eukprot:796100-Amphidinium_carterae.1